MGVFSLKAISQNILNILRKTLQAYEDIFAVRNDTCIRTVCVHCVEPDLYGIKVGPGPRICK